MKPKGREINTQKQGRIGLTAVSKIKKKPRAK